MTATARTETVSMPEPAPPIGEAEIAAYERDGAGRA